MTQKILFFDIESRPALAWVWALKTDYVPLDMIEQPSRMLCFAAKFKGDKRTQFYSEWADGRQTMMEAMWRLLDEADVVVSYNGARFDHEWVNTEFTLAGLTPPSPFFVVDMYQQTRKMRLLSHKLQYVSTFLLKLQGKIQTGGFGLWRRVIDDMQAELGIIRRFDDTTVAKARALMAKYNRQDVDELENMWEPLLPWMKVPNANLFVKSDDGRPVCVKCGNATLQRRGFAHTPQSTFQRYWCNPATGGCGAWMRDKHRVDLAEMVEAQA